MMFFNTWHCSIEFCVWGIYTGSHLLEQRENRKERLKYGDSLLKVLHLILLLHKEQRLYIQRHKMKGSLFVLFFTVFATAEGKNTVSGTVEEDAKWLHSHLSVLPAITASISYHVQYPTSWASMPILKFYDNGQNSSNLRDKCISGLIGQLLNKDLAIPLVESYGTDLKTRVLLSTNYRDKFKCEQIDCSTCWFVKCNCKTWSCYGRTQIQDFEPKSYSFSVGFGCGVTKASLKGMEYDVTIENESNKTRCVDLKSVKKERMDLCDLDYRYAAIPNQLGDTDLDGAITRMNRFLSGRLGIGAGLWKIIMDIPKKSCLKKLKPVQCQIFLPKCLPEENKIHLPCRDTCKSIVKECTDLDTIKNINCDYLPPCSNYMLIIWIIVGVVACLALVALVTICCVRYRKKICQSKGNPEDEDALPFQPTKQ